ncbi:COG4315 family predicted lipoprotein [Streptomyces beihaiensis]|uniref:Lipoprotein with Yx(FWY)xxD motif n=1 Tax=Streptomyces beihaiensis TaxID=2984495 RepID=A0ABT3TUT3_9ACTN|nr:hypothetical protein [Streptomyces beihaiensis]MCX3060804.1 hypothetical protein [Streptomyces beihaiensis]
MKKKSAAVAAAATAVLLAAALSGCSNSSKNSNSSSNNSSSSSPSVSLAPNSTPGATTPGATNPQTSGAEVGLLSGDLGKYLVGKNGRTLYLFEADKSGTSSCYGGCADAWPPLETSSKPMAQNGVKAGLLGTTTRKDGKKQVTYDKHPLYYYRGDTKAGDTTGQGLNQFGAKWYVLDDSGKAITKSGSGSGSGGSSGGGY